MVRPYLRFTATVGLMAAMAAGPMFIAGCTEQGGPVGQAAKSAPADSLEALEESRYAESAPAPAEQSALQAEADGTATTAPAATELPSALADAAPNAVAATPIAGAPDAARMSSGRPTNAALGTVPAGAAPAGAAPVGAEPAAALPYSAAPASPPAPAAPAGTTQFSLPASDAVGPADRGVGPGQGGDKFAYVEENEFLAAAETPLSTFSIDVDTASYSKMRSYLLEHHTLPPPDAVRIEELINYFDYAYAGPADEHPFAVHIETAECPWRPRHRLVRCGIQGKRIDQQRPVSNLVFLIDVSGSMDQPNKLPLVQRSLSMLVRQLGENDRVAIVVYAGAAGLVLPTTSGTEQSTILAAIENLRAGGSTNGGQGIELAYALAQQNLVKGGVNRVLLCTDGDFNVGVTSTGALVRLAEEKSKAGVFLSILGYGFGNHNDAMLEQLSNKANGNYAFIDNDREAQKVLVEQMQGTLVTIAKDVKIQVEFNPAQVAAYRLIGYENRKLADRDFNDDTKDAGDIGAGHSVTALYEIVPVGVESAAAVPAVDTLKYQAKAPGRETGDRGQEAATKLPTGDIARELLTLKLRYQPPAGGKSTLLTFPVVDNEARFGAATADFQFAAAVASFGMLLRNSKHKGDASFAAVLETASAGLREDKRGLKEEFLELVRAAQQLSGERVGFAPPPAWNVPRHAVIGAPRVALAPAAWQPPAVNPPQTWLQRCGVEAPPAWLSGFQPTELLAIGIGVGAIVAVFAVLMGLGILSLRMRRSVSFAPQPVAMKGKMA